MTKREKKLGGILLAALLVVGHMWGIQKFVIFRQDLETAQNNAKQAVLDGENYASMREARADELDWLAKHQPQPTERQTAETNLEDHARKEALRQGLEPKKMKFLPPEESGVHYHRVRAEIEVGGSEASLYRWLDAMQVPDNFRAITNLVIKPQRDDDTKVDCTVIVEQWYVPAQPTS